MISFHLLRESRAPNVIFAFDDERLWLSGGVPHLVRTGELRAELSTQQDPAGSGASAQWP